MACAAVAAGSVEDGNAAVPAPPAIRGGQSPPHSFPVGRAIILMLVNINEAVSGNIVWPFLPFLTSRYALPEDVGFYTGILAASFFLGQALSVSTWGALADKFGRRPVIIIGLLGSGASMLWLGFASTFAETLAARFVCGALNGNVAMNKVYMGEITTAANQAQGFSWLAMTWGVGLILAPTLGGFLADPGTQFPGSILDTALTEEYPYALPSIVAAAVGFTAMLLALFFLPETEVWLARKANAASRPGAAESSASMSTNNHSSDKSPSEIIVASSAANPGFDTGAARTSDVETQGLLAADPDSDDDDDEIIVEGIGDGDIKKSNAARAAQLSSGVSEAPRAASPSSLESDDGKPLSTFCNVLSAPQIGHAIMMYGMLSMVQILFDELMPLFLSAPLNQGGLGWMASDVGVVQIGHGIAQISSQLFVVPYATRRFGLLESFRGALLPLPILLAAFPLVGLLSSLPKAALTVIITLMLALRALLFTVSFTSIMLLINNSSPAPSLGFVTGVAQMMASSVRAVGPAVGGGILSMGMASESLGRWRILPMYFVMAAIAIVTRLFTRGLITIDFPPDSRARDAVHG